MRKRDTRHGDEQYGYPDDQNGEDQQGGEAAPPLATSPSWRYGGGMPGRHHGVPTAVSPRNSCARPVPVTVRV